MLRKNVFQILFLALCFIQFSYAQETKIDSLKVLFEAEKVDSLRLDLGIKLLDAKSDNFPKEALVLADRLLLDKAINALPLRLARVLILKIQILNRISEYQTVIELSNQLEKVVSQHNFRVIQLKLTNEIGLAYSKQSLHNKASEAYQKTFEIATELNNARAQIIALNNLSNAYLATKNYDKVEQVLLLALDIAKKNETPMNIAMVKTNLGNLENERKDFRAAKSYFEEALIIFRKIPMKYGEALVLNNLGFTEFQVRNYDKALDYLDQSEAIKKEIGDQFGLLSSYVKKGDIYKELGNWPKGLQYYEASISLAKEINNIEKLEAALQGLLEVQERSGQTNAALKTFKQLTKLKDSLYQADLQKALDQKKNTIDTSVYKEKIDALENEQSSFKRIIYYGVFVILVLLLILIFLWYRNRKMEKNVHSDAQPKQHTVVDGIADKTERLKESLKNGSFDGAFWIEFGLIFDEIHPNFSKKLNQDFPQLTKSEVRMCALIRLGLHNYDLTKCLNITIRSVQNARYRIYKKMNFENDKAMLAYLFAI